MTQNSPSLHDLEQHDAFIGRHIGPDDAEIATMLEAIGHDSLDAMVDAIVPAAIRQKNPLALPPAVTENEPLRKIRAIADRNEVFRSSTGQGF
jgi:glycine dehydrogenase